MERFLMNLLIVSIVLFFGIMSIIVEKNNSKPEIKDDSEDFWHE
jgi:hypothetical protein